MIKIGADFVMPRVVSLDDFLNNRLDGITPDAILVVTQQFFGAFYDDGLLIAEFCPPGYGVQTFNNDRITKLLGNFLNLSVAGRDESSRSRNPKFLRQILLTFFIQEFIHESTDRQGKNKLRHQLITIAMDKGIKYIAGWK